MGLLREILAERTVRIPLDFGINENIVLFKLDNVERTHEGEVMKRNTFMTFARLNDKKEVVANSEFNYYNLNHEQDAEKVWQNLANQVSQLNNIANCINPGSTVDPTGAFKTEEELVKALTTKVGCDKLIKAMYESFESCVKDQVGENCPPMRLKLVTGSKGPWLQLPNEATIAEPMTQEVTKLTVTAYEVKRKNAATSTTTPAAITGDAKGTAPASNGVLGNLI